MTALQVLQVRRRRGVQSAGGFFRLRGSYANIRDTSKVDTGQLLTGSGIGVLPKAISKAFCDSFSIARSVEFALPNSVGGV